MASPQQIAWLQQAFQAAKAAAVTTTGLSPVPGLLLADWAACAACEAAAESGWGQSTPPRSNNFLGIKAFRGYPGPVVTANGTEQRADGSYTGPQSDLWRVYPSMTACFADQIHILHNQRDASDPTHQLLAYRVALAATTPAVYITNECRVWSTSLQKSQTVLSIYSAHRNELV